MLVRIWLPLVIAVLVLILVVALAPAIAAVLRSAYVVGKRQLDAARDILQGGRS